MQDFSALTEQVKIAGSRTGMTKAVPISMSDDDTAFFAEVNGCPKPFLTCWGEIGRRIQKYTVPKQLECVTPNDEAFDSLTELAQYFVLTGHVNAKALWGKLTAVAGTKVPAPGFSETTSGELLEAHEFVKSLGVTREASEYNAIGLVGPWLRDGDFARIAVTPN